MKSHGAHEGRGMPKQEGRCVVRMKKEVCPPCQPSFTFRHPAWTKRAWIFRARLLVRMQRRGSGFLRKHSTKYCGNAPASTALHHDSITGKVRLYKARGFAYERFLPRSVAASILWKQSTRKQPCAPAHENTVAQENRAQRAEPFV